MDMERFRKQAEFIIEIDKVKNIFRQTYLADGNRKENDAEHSWHLGLMAFLLSEYFEGVDCAKVAKMVLIHDLIEIDAGDTYCYDAEGYKDKAEREKACAKRIYGMLPEDQGQEYMTLWEEFEEGTTPEANFAVILDRFQPVLLNMASDGKAWIEHGIAVSQVRARNEKIMNGPAELSQFFQELLDEAVKRGYLKAEL